MHSHDRCLGDRAHFRLQFLFHCSKLWLKNAKLKSHLRWLWITVIEFRDCSENFKITNIDVLYLSELDLDTASESRIVEKYSAISAAWVLKEESFNATENPLKFTATVCSHDCDWNTFIAAKVMQINTPDHDNSNTDKCPATYLQESTIILYRIILLHGKCRWGGFPGNRLSHIPNIHRNSYLVRLVGLYSWNIHLTKITSHSLCARLWYEKVRWKRGNHWEVAVSVPHVRSEDGSVDGRGDNKIKSCHFSCLLSLMSASNGPIWRCTFQHTLAIHTFISMIAKNMESPGENMFHTSWYNPTESYACYKRPNLKVHLSAHSGSR